jgi:16S rRNA (uracil1498-N3)-methyltransferase
VFEEAGVIKKTPTITLLQALPDKERLELIIEKTTELGIAKIIPFKSKKSISLHEREAGQRKAHRWGDIALRAAKQSRRWSIPKVLSYRSFQEALNEACGELKIVLWEGGGLKPLKEVLKGDRPLSLTWGIKEIDLLVGPEGGFEAEEVEAATREGFIPATLGTRVLRTETAAIISVGLVQYELGG